MSHDTLRVADVRKAIGLALDAFENEHGDEIPIGHDHYWQIPVGGAFDLSVDPTQLHVGQISDDLDEALAINSAEEAFPSWHALNHVIGLLQLMELAALPKQRR